MLQLLLSTVLVFAVLQSAQGDETYMYNLMSTQFFVDTVTHMENRVNAKINHFEQTMEKTNNYVKVAQQYKDMLEIVGKSVYKIPCSIATNMEKLKELNTTYQNSLKECRSQADCKTDLPETAAKIIKTIQEYDAEAIKEVAACTDDACKLKVYDSTHEKLFKLYEDSMPQLRLTVDQALSNSKCYSSILKCMVDKNSDGLKEMYSGIAKVENCLASRGRRVWGSSIWPLNN